MKSQTQPGQNQSSSSAVLGVSNGVDSDGLEQKEVRTGAEVSSTSASTIPAEIHPFDLLIVGEEYKLTNFTGSCPGMVGAGMVTKDGQPPVFHHDACSLTVKSVDDKGKHIHVKATRKDVKDENCNYGVVGTYELEMTLKKDKTGAKSSVHHLKEFQVRLKFRLLF